MLGRMNGGELAKWLQKNNEATLQNKSEIEKIQLSLSNLDCTLKSVQDKLDNALNISNDEGIYGRLQKAERRVDKLEIELMDLREELHVAKADYKQVHEQCNIQIKEIKDSISNSKDKFIGYTITAILSVVGTILIGTLGWSFSRALNTVEPANQSTIPSLTTIKC